ncbi:Sec-independent protein translocase subunit TatA/TatB [Marinobacter fonticola]|uniref:Sec-independent protein translocase subunit TatA/TatB n=1 Tax=Marinobacter fonticola TaxID=2603215 RepID=UPI0011E8917E|nr:preprotein translocase subunit TatB [Marinobacter fonticola]
MFDLSWVELLFCGALALIVIGPKDMPQLFRAGGRLLSKGRRFYSDVVGSMHQLEREVDIASGKGPAHENWRNLIPEDLRNLPSDFRPGAFSAEDHQRRRAAIEQAKRDAEAARQAEADRAATLTDEAKFNDTAPTDNR